MTDYVRVPVEPTQEMIDAICAGSTECQWPDDFGKSAQAMRREFASRAYRALLSAAPQAIAPEGMPEEPEYDVQVHDKHGEYQTQLWDKCVDWDEFRRFKQYADALRSYAESLLRAGERDVRIVRAYCAANDYINAMLNTGIPAESLDKIAAAYWQAVKEV